MDRSQAQTPQLDRSDSKIISASFPHENNAHGDPGLPSSDIPKGRLADRLVHLAPHLEPADAALLLALLVDGKSHIDLARLLNRCPRFVSRRALITRCTHPAFAFCVLHFDTFDIHTRFIARHCIFHGKSIRTCALALNTSQYRIRQAHTQLLAMAAGARHTARLIRSSTAGAADDDRPRPRRRSRLAA